MKPSTETDTGAVGRRIIRGMIVVVFFGLFLKFGGFLMNLLILSYYGKGQVYDIFTAVYGNIIILFFFSSALKVLLPAFMPLFAERMHEEGERGAWQFTNTLINLLLIALVGTAVFVFIFAPQIITTLLPGFSAEAQARATELFRWMIPGLMVILVAIKAQGILNSYKVFSYPAAAEATQKLVWAAAIFATIAILGFRRDVSLAPRVIGAGFLAGCLAQAAVLLTGLRKRVHLYRPSFPEATLRMLLRESGWLGVGLLLFLGWVWIVRFCGRLPEGARFHLAENDRKFMALTGLLIIGCLYTVWLWHRGRRGKSIMARFAMLASPLMIGVLFARYRDLTSVFFQSYTAEGDFGMIEWAKKVTQMPTIVVAYSLAIVMFPFLCDLAAKKETERLAVVVRRALKMITLFFLPLTAITVVLAGPVMQLLADRGAWTAADIRSAGLALGILACGMFFMAIENVLMQTFFSLQRTVLPTALGILFSVLYSVGLYVTIERLGFDEPAQVFLVVCIAYPIPRALKK